MPLSKKRKRTPPPAPLRRSARLNFQDATASSSTSRPTMPPPPPLQRGLFILSTDTEASETMPKLLSDANERISLYTAQGRQDEDKLKPALQAFLEWLPDDGKVSIARDILHATTDDLLYQMFFNLFTALAMPMKTRSHAGSVKRSPHPHRLDAEEAVASTLDDPLEREKKFRDDLETWM
ncbi:hypothetical protein AnigIFM63326_009355 [Aspergillus niger]|nr:hypothetical protein AnigIFM63326_009355 [Aspergillus niger]